MYRDMGNSFDDVKVKLEDVTALLYPQRQHQPEPGETNPGVAMLESHHGGIESWSCVATGHHPKWLESHHGGIERRQR